MSRTVKQDIDLLFDIKKQVKERLNIDYTIQSEIDEADKYVVLIFENQNKWLLSDKISSEKQSRMDQYSKDKGMGTPGGEESPPTAKQISYATTLGIDVSKRGYTRKTLSEAIDKAKKE